MVNCTISLFQFPFRPEDNMLLISGHDDRQNRRKKTKNLIHDHRIEKFPSTCKPMLGTLIDRPFDSSEWVFEVK